MENNFFDPLSDEAIQASFGSWKSDVTPKNGEVPDPHQPRLRPPLIAGHASFRPYVEPILKPRPPEWEDNKGPLYNPFEKPYEPREHRDPQIFDGPGAGTVANAAWKGGARYQQRIITPSMSSTKDLFKQETEIVEKDTLKEMLPPDGKLEDYLPTIQWAIKLTTWSHKAEIKCKKLYTKLKKQAKKWLGKDELDVFTPKYSEYESVKPEDMWYPQVSPEIEREYQKSIEEALSNPGKSPADTWASVQKLSDRNVNAPIYNRPLSDEVKKNLKIAYKALETVLSDYKSLGLLQFQGSWNSKTKEVVRNWAQLYDVFTHTSLEVYKNTVMVNDLPWELVEYSSIHRQIQGLPISILVKLPFLPDLNDTSFTDIEDFCKKLANSLETAKDYLSDIGQRYIQDSVWSLSTEEHTKVASYRQRMHRILAGRKYTFFPPDSPRFLAEDLLQIPASVVLKVMSEERSPLQNPQISPEMLGMMLKTVKMSGNEGLSGNLASLLMTPTYEKMSDQQVIDVAKDEYYSYLKNLESSINRITSCEDSNVG